MFFIARTLCGYFNLIFYRRGQFFKHCHINMARQIQLRRGTESQHNTFTGAEGEVTFDITNKTLRVHDGQTPGGVMMAKHGEGMPENADYVIEKQTPTEANNYTWYRKYKSGWVEQGGIWKGSMTCAQGMEANPIVTLPILMSNNNYYANAMVQENYTLPMGMQLFNNSIKFRFGAYTVDRTLSRFVWTVCGMAA